MFLVDVLRLGQSVARRDVHTLIPVERQLKYITWQMGILKMGRLSWVIQEAHFNHMWS